MERCVPGRTVTCACVDGLIGSQTCAEDGRYTPCECSEGTLQWFRSNIVGEWEGLRTTPWDDNGPESVTLEFTEDGTWNGSCGRDCPVFYYGSWMETSGNRYRFTSVGEEAVGYGHLSVSWPLGEPTEGELREVRFESEQTELFFDFVPTWLGDLGPISFELERRR